MKAIRSQADRVQEVLLALTRQVEGMTREANTRVVLCQDLVVKEVYRSATRTKRSFLCRRQLP